MAHDYRRANQGKRGEKFVNSHDDLRIIEIMTYLVHMEKTLTKPKVPQRHSSRLIKGSNKKFFVNGGIHIQAMKSP